MPLNLGYTPLGYGARTQARPTLTVTSTLRRIQSTFHYTNTMPLLMPNKTHNVTKHTRNHLSKDKCVLDLFYFRFLDLLRIHDVTVDYSHTFATHVKLRSAAYKSAVLRQSLLPLRPDQQQDSVDTKCHKHDPNVIYLGNHVNQDDIWKSFFWCNIRAIQNCKPLTLDAKPKLQYLLLYAWLESFIHCGLSDQPNLALAEVLLEIPHGCCVHPSP